MTKNLMTSNEKYKFLFHVTNKLTRPLNHTLSIKEVSKLIVPKLADFCRIAMVDESNEVVEITVNHTDPTKVSVARDLFDAYKDDPNSTMGIPHVLKTGKAEILSVINDKVLANMKTSKKITSIVKKLGLKSYMGVPLIARGKVVGAMTFSSIKEGRHYSDADLKFAGDIARRIAFALDSAKLFKSAQDELKERVQYETQLRFLAEASKILSSSLDYNTTLSNVAKLAIDYMADWCAIDMLQKAEIKSVVIMHRDPKKVAFAKLIRKRQPPTNDPRSAVYQVIHTGLPIHYPTITPELISQTVKDKKVLKIIKKIGLYSIMVVPIVINSKPVGSITFISSTPKYQYSERELRVAEEVASRAALAIENAKLYSDSQEAVRLRDDFISIASHELKTPVTTLKMHTQLMQKMFLKLTPTPLSASLEKMNRQINKLTDLISDLLNVSRIQQGKIEFREEEFDINKLVKEAAEAIQPTANNHKIKIKGRIIKTIHGDKDRIYQVIINLLTNAIKYSPNAKKVVISLTPLENKARVSVKDYGIGIKQAYLKKIFKLFYRVSTPEAVTYPGLGVGLYISNEIVKRHKGKLEVKSIYGKGSTFSFSIPYKK